MLLSAITLSLELQRTSFDLLDALSVEVAVHNSNKGPAGVHFATPSEYAIDVLRNGNVVWSSTTHSASSNVTPPHVRQLMPGPTVLAVYIWNETTQDGASISPGDYIIRARLLGENEMPEASAHVRFTEPVPISALASFHRGEEITIAGRLDDSKQTIADSTGSITLTKRLTGAPDAPVAVRGYVTTLPGKERAFFVERWARLGP